jgi:hypothetical protein
MDGRVQMPATAFLKERFNVDHVDVITEAGPNRILGRQSSPRLIESIFDRLHISVKHHHSVGIAVVGHHDCAGNSANQEDQIADTVAAVKYIRERGPQDKDITVIGLWIDENWSVSEMPNKPLQSASVMQNKFV